MHIFHLCVPGQEGQGKDWVQMVPQCIFMPTLQTNDTCTVKFVYFMVVVMVAYGNVLKLGHGQRNTIMILKTIRWGKNPKKTTLGGDQGIRSQGCESLLPTVNTSKC